MLNETARVYFRAGKVVFVGFFTLFIKSIFNRYLKMNIKQAIEKEQNACVLC